MAFVRREPGRPLTEGEVIEHCRGRIASFKIPRHVVFVDEFPMTSSGKIQKVKLRERGAAGVALVATPHLADEPPFGIGHRLNR